MKEVVLDAEMQTSPWNTNWDNKSWKWVRWSPVYILECILSSHLHHLCSFDFKFLCYCCSYRCAHGNSLEQAVVFSVEKDLSSFQVQILHSHSHLKAPLSPPGTLSTFCLRPTLTLTVRLSTCCHPVPLVTHSWFVLFSTYSNPLPSPLPSPFPPLHFPSPLPALPPSPHSGCWTTLVS